MAAPLSPLSSRWRAPPGFAGLAVSLALVSACSHQIGDSCQQNVDCSPLGDRYCDIASPNGYCTIESCDYYSCPTEAVCVRFFSLLRANKACAFNSAHPDQTGCTLDELCLCSDNLNTSTQSCVGPAYCAPLATERRWCMLACNSDSDCRTVDGYTCQQSGRNGAIPTPYMDMNGKLQDWPTYSVKFCAPAPMTPALM